MLKLSSGIAVALLAVSCASSGTPARSDSSAPQPAASRNRNIITETEVKESSARDAYHAVQLLRPDWLRSRGSVSMRDPTPPQVIAYVDGQRYGGVGSLEQFRVGSFKEIRFYTGSEATSRWGTGHAGGVVYLTTR
jgi:hypothetical protein